MERHHSLTRYDNELQNLQNLLMEMARLTESQLHQVCKYLRGDEEDVNQLSEVDNLDNRVNQYHVDINLESIRLIAKRAPVAVDLRYISAVFRISTDLERIGDECCKIARFLQRDKVDVNVRIWREIRPASKLAKNLLARTIDMLGRSDANQAHLLINDDIELDDNYHSTTRLIASYMVEDSSVITESIDVLMAAKALERIGDHCINIAEAIIFAREGQDVRHQSLRDNQAANE